MSEGTPNSVSGEAVLTEQRTGITRGQWLVLAAAFLGWMFDGVEIGLFPLASRPALQELLKDIGDADVGWWNGIVVACFLLGAAMGGLVFGWLGDRIGRVRAMVISILVYSLFTGAGAFAGKAWHLGIFRFLASLGMGGEWAVAVALVVECWPERHRPKLAGAIGAAANFGFLFIGVFAYYFPVMSAGAGQETAAAGVVGYFAWVLANPWRRLMLVGAIPAVLALAVSLMVPESERWKAAAKTAKKLPITEIFAPGLWKKTLLAIVFSSIPLIGTWAAVSGWIPNWVEQMMQAKLVEQDLPATALTGVAPSGLGEALKEAKKSLSPEQWVEIETAAARSKAGIQIVLAIGAILACFVAPVIGGIWGRRPVYFLLCLLSLISCACLFRWMNPFDTWFGPMTFVVGGVTAAFYGWLPLYLPELFPTRVRATGQGLSFNFGRILAAAAAFQMGNFVKMLGGNYASAGATITLIYVLGLLLIWFAPETKGKPLPE
jgi:MFS family permease